jgi:hypothetical protein
MKKHTSLCKRIEHEKLKINDAVHCPPEDRRVFSPPKFHVSENLLVANDRKKTGNTPFVGFAI